MNNQEELYAHVNATIQNIRNRGNEKLTATLVVKEAKRKRQDTLNMYRRIMDEEAKEKRDREANAISQFVGAAILKDRSEHIARGTAALNEIVERMNDICDVMREDISSLQDEKDNLEEQLSAQRNNHEVQIQELERNKSQLEGRIQNLTEQADSQVSQIKDLTGQRDDADEKYRESFEGLAKCNAKLESANDEIESLRQKLEEERHAHEKIEKAKVEAEKETRRLEGEIDAMKKMHETFREDKNTEFQALVEACTASAAANTRLDERSEKITQELQTKKPDQPTAPSTPKHKRKRQKKDTDDQKPDK